MTTFSYRERWALVTGASAGLGAEFARQLAARGMHLVLAARRRERLEQLARELTDRYRITALVEPADLAAAGEPLHLWERASAGRTIDLLVNNAGIGFFGRFEEVPAEKHAQTVRLNCIAPMELAHAALTSMRPRGRGAILNVASLTSFQPLPRYSTYAASKAFVLSLSQALWAENRRAGVRVVAVCPGKSPTEFQALSGSAHVTGRTIAMRSPEVVVAAALRALEAGRMMVVPGWENRIASIGGRLAPRRLLTSVVEKIMERGGSW